MGKWERLGGGVTDGSRYLWKGCWLGSLSRDILGVEEDAFLFRESVNVSEDVVGGLVPAPALPPAFDTPSVISKNLDVGAPGDGWEKGGDKE